MAEYIEREEAIKNIKEHQCRNCSDIGICGNCAVLTAIKLFENIPAVDVQPMKWISMTERLPNENGEYIVLGKGKVWVCEFMILDGVVGWCNSAMNPFVEYWMPLPEPPKGDEL